jgi:hypothetical protein
MMNQVKRSADSPNKDAEVFAIPGPKRSAKIPNIAEKRAEI